MRIVLLAHNLRSAGGLVGGKNFVNALAQAAGQHQYLITVPANCGYEDIALPKNSELYICPKPGSISARLQLEMWKIPSAVKRYGADAVLGLGNFGLATVDCPQAIWIRYAYFVYPSKHYPEAPIKSRMFFQLQRFYLRRILPKTKLLFCQTPIMRERISEFYNYDIEKIKILPNALSGILKAASSKEPQACPPSIERGKFNCLVLSKYYIHKNPQIIIDAYKKAKKCLKDFRFITTVSKEDDPRAKAFLNRINQDGDLKDYVHNVGPIAHEKLGSYYRNVQLLVMPTLLESFSVTYLEAMCYGVPILTTDLDFARYICGEAAVYYDPWQQGSFLEKLLMLKSSPQTRNRLIEAGREQLKKFSSTWNDVVKAAMKEIEAIVRRGN